MVQDSVLEQLLKESDKIRNVSIIANVDHGKSTLTDRLIEGSQLDGADSYFSHHHLSLVYENPSKKMDHHLINVINCPGHVDYSSEVVSTLRITDGAILVVDAVEGHNPTQSVVIRQAIQEKVKPILFINKIDRLIEELRCTEEESYQILARIVESVNVSLCAYSDSESVVSLDPIDCNVAFGSARMGWAFTLDQFAQFYSTKFNFPKEKFMKKLWGDYYFDRSRKQFIRQPYSPTTGQQLKHTFCEFVLEPLYKIFQHARDHQPSSEDTISVAFEQILDKICIPLTKEEKKQTPKLLLGCIMRKFLPIQKSLVQMIINHLPSPKEAQQSRVGNLYTGEDLTDPYATGIKECDSNAPLVVYVSKMISNNSTYSNALSQFNNSDHGRFIALARVFSGSLTQSTTIRILGPGYPNRISDVFHTSLSPGKLLFLAGSQTKVISRASCGSIIGIVGLDQFIIKSCTLTEEGEVACMPIRDVKQLMTPVIKMGVESVNVADLPRFTEGLKHLVQSEASLLECKEDDTGLYILGASSEIHLETCLTKLKEYTRGIQIKRSPPIVSFHETVSNWNSSGDEMVMVTSPNNHNRLYMQAEPIREELIELISGEQFPMDDPNRRAELLDNNIGWDHTVTKKLWSFGPEIIMRSNILIDDTNTTSMDKYIMNEIKPYVVTGFQMSSASGGLCDEVMRGVMFKLKDCQLHADAIHRGGGQLIRASSRAMIASQLIAAPKLVEPIYRVEVQCPQSVIGSVIKVISNRGGDISTISTDCPSPQDLTTLVGHLPVLESFGLIEEIKSETEGQAFPYSSFSHWQAININEDVYNPQSKVNKLIKSIRLRKGLKEDIPHYTDYCDMTTSTRHQ